MAQLKKAYLVSYYPGKPATVGLAKATGELTLWEEKLTFEIQLGSAAGNAFGIAGMLAARRKARQNGSFFTYLFTSVDKAQAGKYMGIQSMLTLTLKDGSQHSFAGFFDAETWVGMINTRLPGHASGGRAAGAKTPAARSADAPEKPAGRDTEPESQGSAVPPAAAGQEDEPIHTAVHQRVYYEGPEDPSDRSLGTLTLSDSGIDYEGSTAKANKPTRFSVPYSRIRSVRHGKDSDFLPQLFVETADGRTFSFFRTGFPAESLEAQINLRMTGRPAKSAVRCKYCGHEYKDGDAFCTECGAIETIR